MILELTQSKTHSLASKTLLEEATQAILQMGDRCGPSTPLPSRVECQAVVDAWNAYGSKFATVADAAAMAGKLIGSYPQRNIPDAETYVDTIKQVLAAHPPMIGARAIQLVLMQSRFLPTVAEICEAIEIERKKSATVAAKAAWALTEHERREREARREAELAAIPQATRDRMYEQAQAIVRKLSGEQVEAQ